MVEDVCFITVLVSLKDYLRGSVSFIASTNLWSEFIFYSMLPLFCSDNSANSAKIWVVGFLRNWNFLFFGEVNGGKSGDGEQSLLSSVILRFMPCCLLLVITISKSLVSNLLLNVSFYKVFFYGVWILCCLRICSCSFDNIIFIFLIVIMIKSLTHPKLRAQFTPYLFFKFT